MALVNYEGNRPDGASTACAVHTRWLRHDSADVAVSAMKAYGGVEV